jgi:hypothetical protein
VDETLEEDMRRDALSLEDAKDRGLCRSIHGGKRPTRVMLNIP